MRKGEFKYFLDGYKKVNEIAKKIIEEKFKDWEKMEKFGQLFGQVKMHLIFQMHFKIEILPKKYWQN